MAGSSYNVHDYGMMEWRIVDKLLLVEIEQLRGKMVEKAMKKKTLVHREVLELSQMLDELIVRQQMLRAHSHK